MELDQNRIPTHVAFICDGNGRWAKKRLQPRTFGHRKGGFTIRDIARSCNKLGIKYATFFCFSTENWNRPKEEVEYLMTAPLKFINRFYKDIVKGNGRLRLIGRKDRLSKEFLDLFKKLEDETKDHTGVIVNLCVDYGSYDEITTAVKKIAEMYKNDEIKLDDITPKLIENNLFTKDLPPLDLLIRTSGEVRISNFLLWQLGYAELYFTDVLWPDFNKKELIKAIKDYQSRDRRFGGIKNDNK
jgi:undecaprenyl diphosphate synthase